MKCLIPTLALALATVTACQNESTSHRDNVDTGNYVSPQTGSEGMTIPNRDTPHLESSDPDLLQRVDSNMQNNTEAPPQSY